MAKGSDARRRGGQKYTLLFGVFNTVLDVDVLEVLGGLSIELLLMVRVVVGRMIGML